MPFMRIILPLVIAGLFIYAPLLEQSSDGTFTGPGTDMVTGAAYVGQSVDCAMELQFNPLAEGCGPQNGITGWVVYAAVAVSAVAAIIGVLGLLPFLAGISGFLTFLSGAAGTAASGTLLYQIWEKGMLGDVQWFMWAALAVSLLTVLVGMSSMSRKSD
ncbi:hypothetical protein GCM10011342_05070 [Aquisalinus flavus]|uniref:Uncharacterized protein n=2 Tax=Aquisalinus flavus TaxID=1526572 RepID=A0A8J2V3T5_9PROT|nr:hypothetical protein GCM10011342_05070 [Aquisalinus flavus]